MFQPHKPGYFDSALYDYFISKSIGDVYHLQCSLSFQDKVNINVPFDSSIILIVKINNFPVNNSMMIKEVDV